LATLAKFGNIHLGAPAFSPSPEPPSPPSPPARPEAGSSRPAHPEAGPKRPAAGPSGPEAGPSAPGAWGVLHAPPPQGGVGGVVVASVAGRDGIGRTESDAAAIRAALARFSSKVSAAPAAEEDYDQGEGEGVGYLSQGGDSFGSRQEVYRATSSVESMSRDISEATGFELADAAPTASPAASYASPASPGTLPSAVRAAEASAAQRGTGLFAVPEVVGEQTQRGTAARFRGPLAAPPHTPELPRHGTSVASGSIMAVDETPLKAPWERSPGMAPLGRDSVLREGSPLLREGSPLAREDPFAQGEDVQRTNRRMSPGGGVVEEEEHWDLARVSEGRQGKKARDDGAAFQ
ncbi:hypothetical protein T484DRAFT_1785794, partial [Baffinella frigidus]